MTIYEYYQALIAKSAENVKKYAGDINLSRFWENAKMEFETRRNCLTVEEAEHDFRFTVAN